MLTACHESTNLMSDSSNTWNTSITQIEPNRVTVRGYSIDDLMDRVSFGAAVYLILRGELPGEGVARLMDAILLSSIDHGVTPPSAQAARTVASTGATLSASVAAGVMSINEYHGGAVRNCALRLQHIVHRINTSEDDAHAVAEAVVNEMKRSGQRMSGFGHRIHTDDPRAARLFDLAISAGVKGPHMEAAWAVERVFAAADKRLPINVDGAIAAILADLEFDPAMMNGIFMIARAPGLVAHVHEEQTTQRPMRHIDPKAHRYNGPAPRRVDDTEQ